MRRALASLGAGRRRLVAVATVFCLAGLAWAQDEVPFITTPDQVTLAMLELARVGPADHVIDLGSGDGRIVITAAKRFGARGLGVEIVPAQVQGTWCGAGGRLDIAQRFQAFSATWSTAASPVPVVFDGRIEGRALHGQGPLAIELASEGEALRTRRADNAAATGWPVEAVFRRATSGRC